MKNGDEKKQIDLIFSRYPTRRAATLPLLTMAQEKFGYISHEAALWVSKLVEISPMEVLETASFYTLYQTSPCGKNKLRLCTNISCWLSGSSKIAKKLCEKFGLSQNGGTTSDQKYHLEFVECLGYCDQAPVLQKNKRTYGNVTTEKLDEIV
ncbi:MAG: NAD(P)H-dependent oxidoreductase subunit E [Deltaproteobacteria bacterium]|nr:NAD(P)H-dependent oxidoreductase subunit E [Deltaproteobacteria bacterium]